MQIGQSLGHGFAAAYFTGTITVDTINEYSGDNGVVVESVTIKDGNLDLTAAAHSIGASLGANTLTIGGATTTVDIPGNLNIGATIDIEGVKDEDDMSSDSAVFLATQQSIKAYVDGRVVGLLDYKGEYNASTNTPDLDTDPSAVLKGDAYSVTVAGTFFDVAVEVGDFLIAEQDDPDEVGNWTIINKNLDAASATVPGIVELATQAEVTTGTDTARAITPDALKDSSITLTQVTVGNTGLVVGSSTPFSDSSGTLTLQNIDAIDATTEATIETAIDTLANLTSIQSRAVTLSGSFTVEADSIINQDVSSDASATLGNLDLAAGGALRTKTSDTNSLLLQAYDVDGTAYTTFITLTAGNTPTCVLSSAVTGTTQSAGTNTTQLATTAFVKTAFETPSISSVTNITAAGGITKTAVIMKVQGNSAAIDITADPQIAAGSTDGEELELWFVHATYSVKLDNGTGLQLQGGTSFTGKNGDRMKFNWDADATKWVEASRSAN